MQAENTSLTLEKLPLHLVESIYSSRLSSYWFRLAVNISAKGNRLLLHNQRKVFSETTVASYAISRDIRYTRKTEFIAEGKDEVCIFIPDTGVYACQSGGGHFDFNASGCLLFRSSDVGSLHMHGPASGFVVRLPLGLLRERISWIEDRAIVCNPASAPFSRVVRTFCSALLRTDFLEQSTPLQATLVDLLTLLMERGEKDYLGDVIPYSYPQLAWSNVQIFLRENFRDSGVSARSAAHSLGISERYVHKLMKLHDMTFGKALMDVRVSESRRMLRDNSKIISVGEVAFACGFKNQGHFSTSYKKAFGLSPRDDRLA